MRKEAYISSATISACADTAAALKKPGLHSIKLANYRRHDVASKYDARRWGTHQRACSDHRDWRTILRAFAIIGKIDSVLDLPCGTGRFIERLKQRGYLVTGADSSPAMINQARCKFADFNRFICADAKKLPYADASFDCVLSARFLFHFDRQNRIDFIREMARVSRRWLILDYRHRYNLRYLLWKVRHALGLTKRPRERLGTAGLKQELDATGLKIVKILSTRLLTSDKWIVICEVS